MFERGAPTGNGNGNKINVRLDVLERLLDSMASDGTTAKANALRHAIRRGKADMPDDADKSLDAMRRIFQKDITNELRQIIDRHLRTTFSPAIENLRRNGHDIGECEVDSLCRSILEAAKSSYSTPARKRTLVDMETDGEGEEVGLKRGVCESGEDSDASALSSSATASGGERRRRRPRGRKDEEAVMKEASSVSLNEALKWNPERFTASSRFLFASRLASTLCIPTSLFFAKYPRFFRYVCEEEDKTELYEKGQLSRLSGRAVILLLDDAFDVLGHSPELERYSFTVSNSILERLRLRSHRVYEHLCQRVASSPLFSFQPPF